MSAKTILSQALSTERVMYRRQFLLTSGVLASGLYAQAGIAAGWPASGTPALVRYRIDDQALTTAGRTVVPGPINGSILPQQLSRIAAFEAQGYGNWRYGSALAHELRTDLMGDRTTAASQGSKTLLRYFVTTDIHLTDKESPSQLIYLQQLNQYGTEASMISIYSPSMLYTAHVLDAAVQTVNALHKERPIDFGISLGDVCNSGLHNETRWYIDIMDGQPIRPSSGAHVGEDQIDYQKPFKAAGLDPAIPWYQAIGNHDHFWLGSIPPDGAGLGLRESCTSDQVLAWGNALARGRDIYNVAEPRFYMGVIDGATPHGDVVKTGAVQGMANPPKVVPDPDRRLLHKHEWIEEFFKTRSQPVGHGFHLVPPNQEKGFACYSFMPRADVPLKVIVLDNTQRQDDGSQSIHGHGFLDAARWAWLKQELAAGDAADQLMIIAAHIPIGVAPKGSFMEWYDKNTNPKDRDNPAAMDNAVSLPELLKELHSHPNLLMWMAGHRHVNTVKAFVSDDPSQPQRGFWQVETSSLLAFPQQFRLFEIRLTKDHDIAIMATNVDPAVRPGTPAAKSRTYAVATQQIVRARYIQMDGPEADNLWIDPLTQMPRTAPDARTQRMVPLADPSIRPMPLGSYNAELLVPLSARMKARLRDRFPAT